MLLTHHHSVCQPLIPTTFTFLLLLFLCLICSEMITLLIRPMRQLHPHLFHRVACPLSTADANNSGSGARLLCTSVHAMPAPSPACGATGVYHSCSRPLYFEYQLVISSLCPPTPASRYSPPRPPPPYPPRATPIGNLATRSVHPLFAISYHLSGWTIATATVLTHAPNAYQLPLVYLALHSVRYRISCFIYFRVGSSSGQ